MAVGIPGPVLSSLIYQLKSSEGDTVGVLLGELRRQRVATITDSQLEGTREERRTCVQAFSVIGHRRRFSDAHGYVNLEELSCAVDGQLKSIVGWFVYRRNTSHTMSLCESAIHHSMMDTLPLADPDDKKEFVYALFTESVVEGAGVHALEYSLYQWTGSRFRPVALQVATLHSSATLPYDTLPVTLPLSSLSAFSDVLQSSRHNLLTKDGVAVSALATEQLYKNFLKRLQPVRDELMSTAELVTKLQAEVDQLQDQLHSPASHHEDEHNVEMMGDDQSELPLLIQLGDEIAGIGNTDTTATTLGPSAAQYDLISGSPPPSSLPTNLTLPLDTGSPMQSQDLI